MSDAAISFPILGDTFVIDPPRYFTLFGRSFYLYGVVIAIGFIAAAAYMLSRRRRFGFTQDNVIDILLCAVPVGVVGARLYYVIFNPANYFGAGKWLNIFKIWEGGLAIYGGIIAGVIGVFVYSRVKKIPLGAILDLCAFGVLIGQIFGRWGNFFNREAFGSETASIFRMGLITESGTLFVHPTFLYESVWNLVGLIFLHFYSKKRRRFDGQLFVMYAGWYGLGRYWIEGLRTDSLYIGSSDIRVSQLLAALSFGAALIILVCKLLKKGGDKPLYADSVDVDRLEAEMKDKSKKSSAGTAEESAEKAEDAESDDDDEYEYVYVDENGNEIGTDSVIPPDIDKTKEE